MEIRGNDIREARKKAGFTQESLADVAGFLRDKLVGLKAVKILLG